MVELPDLLGGIFIISSAVCLYVVYYSYRNRGKSGALPLVLMVGGAGGWSIVYGAGTVVNNEGLTFAADNLRLLFVDLTVIGWIFVASEYTNRKEWLMAKKIFLGLLFAIPILTQIFAWTNGSHHLIRTPQTTVNNGLLDPGFGAWFWVHMVFDYFLLLAGSVMIMDEFLSSQGVYKKQAGALVGGVAVGWIANILYITNSKLELTPYSNLDITPIGITITGVIFAWALFRFSLLDLVPVAREAVIENMEDSVIVLDNDGRVVDINPSAKELLGIDSSAIGKPGLEVFSDYEDVARRFADVKDTNTEVSLETEDGEIHLDLNISPIQDRRGETAGRLIVLRDITERVKDKRELEEKTEELERQNEQLEQFASVVSHDLRNPLEVAEGFFEMIEEEHEDEINDIYVKKVNKSHTRMENIIEDVLTLARQGKTVSETEEVDLKKVVDNCWEMIDKKEANLEISDDLGKIEADKERLPQIFENLFRNAIEHGREDVTIRVGSLENREGFYVEDDGPGIPEDKREKVLEHGYTTNDDGTGFGLSIVKNISEAHGWKISVSESEDGGARFEITVSGRKNTKKRGREVSKTQEDEEKERGEQVSKETGKHEEKEGVKND